MNLIEQFKKDLALRKTVSELDLTAGMTDSPSLTAFDGDDPRLGTYLGGLRRVQETIKEVAGSPEQVFLGDINLGRQLDLLVLTRRDHGNRQISPRMTFGVVLPDVNAVDQELAVMHLTHLAAANLGVDPKDQKSLADQATKSLKKNSSIFAEVGITPKWNLEVYVNNRSRTVTPSLIPVEKPQYSEHWVDRQTKLVKQSIRPEALCKTVMAAAASNFCVTNAVTAKVDQLNLGGFVGAERLVREQGWEPIKEADITDDSILNLLSDRTETYRHSGYKSGEPASLLGKANLVREETVRFSAIPNPALKQKIRDEFAEKFKFAAHRVIKQRIAGIPADKTLINLSPASFVSPVLESLGQHNLEYRDKEQAEDWLSSVIAKTLIDELRHYPEARPIAERLVVLQELAGDQSTLTHDPNAKIDFSLNETAMQFHLPKEWFTKK